MVRLRDARGRVGPLRLRRAREVRCCGPGRTRRSDCGHGGRRPSGPARGGWVRPGSGWRTRTAARGLPLPVRAPPACARSATPPRRTPPAPRDARGVELGVGRIRAEPRLRACLRAAPPGARRFQLARRACPSPRRREPRGGAGSDGDPAGVRCGATAWPNQARYGYCQVARRHPGQRLRWEAASSNFAAAPAAVKGRGATQGAHRGCSRRASLDRGGPPS